MVALFKKELQDVTKTPHEQAEMHLTLEKILWLLESSWFKTYRETIVCIRNLFRIIIKFFYLF